MFVKNYTRAEATLFFFYKNIIVFPAEAELSNFSVDFRLKKFSSPFFSQPARLFALAVRAGTHFIPPATRLKSS